jgi:hypothetical protein
VAKNAFATSLALYGVDNQKDKIIKGYREIIERINA